MLLSVFEIAVEKEIGEVDEDEVGPSSGERRVEAAIFVGRSENRPAVTGS